MTLKKLYVLAALAGLLVSDSVAAQQSSISDRMRHQTVRPVQKRQPASRLATFSGTSAKSDGTATNATTADSAADKSAEAAQSDAGDASQVQQIPMREKIRPAVMTRVLEQSPDNSATSRRPIELTGFAPDSEDNGDFLKSLDASTQLVKQQYDAYNSDFQSKLGELNLQADIANGLTGSAAKILADNAQVTAKLQNEANQFNAKMSNDQATGFGKLLGLGASIALAPVTGGLSLAAAPAFGGANMFGGRG